MNSNDERHEHAMLAFVLMPFEPELDGVYHDLIVPALEDVGYEVGRADSVFGRQSTPRDTIDNIARADLIIAELSTPNANVMYELGVAHGLAKVTVMLTQDLMAVPFDLRSYRLITYTWNDNEVGKLRDQLKAVAWRHREGSVAELVERPRPVANPWLATAGSFADDPKLLPMLDEIYATRAAGRAAGGDAEDDAE